MAGRSLAGLVAEAREHLVEERSVREWFTDRLEYPDTAIWATFTRWLADEIVRLAGCGVYRTDWGPWLADDASPVPLGDVVHPYWDDFLYLLPECPDWMSFREVCGLAERIDSFLATLEGAGPGAELARGCRQDLDGLAVLADWCEENGRSAAAAEARHLHGLVRGALG